MDKIDREILYLTYLSVPMLAYFGYIAAFSDVRTGRIPNRCILLGLKMGLAWHLLFTAYLMWIYRSMLVPEGVEVILEYLRDVGFNSAIALAVAFGMWWLHLWAAGDAKMFAAYVFMVPIMFYDRVIFASFPAFALLYNIFVCALAVVLLDFAWKCGAAAMEQRRHGRVWRVIRENVNRRALGVKIRENWGAALRVMVGFVFGFLVTSLLRKGVSAVFVKSVGADPRGLNTGEPLMLIPFILKTPILFLVFFLLYRPISQLFRNRVAYFTAAVCIVGYLLFSAVLLGNFRDVAGDVAHFGGLSGLLIVFRGMYDYYSRRVNVRKIPIDELREHMILSKRTREALGEEGGALLGEDPVFYADGLTREQVEGLKGWKKLDPIEVSGTIPFAPCIFLGVIVTVVTREFLLNWIFPK